MKMEPSGSVRARADDEATAAGCETTHTFYIICPATAVRATHSFLALLPVPLLTVAICLPGLCAQRPTIIRAQLAVVQVPHQRLVGELA